MLNLTRQEKSVVLFLACVGAIGIGANYYLKNSAPLQIPVNRPHEPKEFIRININRAGADELVKAPGIGKVLAWRIIQYRDMHGSFIFLEDIQKVKGIGPSKFNKIREYLAVE